MKNGTRGTGILENFLSLQRQKLARSFMKNDISDCSILDIGCGLVPNFLLSLEAKNKYGIDRVVRDENYPNINITNLDIVANQEWGFDNNMFDYITSLAFLEHIYFQESVKIISNAYKILKLNGTVIITTPSKWTDGLIKTMAKLNLVSQEEIHEHKVLFTQKKLRELFLTSGFRNENIKTGTFEFGMNLYCIASK